MEPLSFKRDLSELSTDDNRRHEELVDLFGQFMVWIRNWSLRTSSRLLDSEEARQELGAIRRRCFEAAAKMTADEKSSAISLAEGTLDLFLKRFVWCLGNEGTDARFGTRHAYRFEVRMEIVDVDTGETVHTESINRGGKFFGSYWGRWLNRYGDK
jgi:hypothetical protein